MAAEHGIIGDEFGTELPQTEVSQEQLVREKQMSKFYKSSEYTILKNYLEDRIKFYQTRLPNGTPVVDKDMAELDVADWKVANLVVSEFQSVLDAYENAREVVQEASKKK